MIFLGKGIFIFIFTKFVGTDFPKHAGYGLGFINKLPF